jgi:hypothetical protein
METNISIDENINASQSPGNDDKGVSLQEAY